MIYFEKRAARADGRVFLIVNQPESIFFDANVYINLLKSPLYERKVEIFLPGAYLYVINKIVLMELWAGVSNKTEENILKKHQHMMPMIGLSDDNFIVAGQIMNHMRRFSQHEPKMRRRLTWDILMALSAKENNALLLTENKKDFEQIKNFLGFEFMTVGDAQSPR